MSFCLAGYLADICTTSCFVDIIGMSHCLKLNIAMHVNCFVWKGLSTLTAIGKRTLLMAENIEYYIQVSVEYIVLDSEKRFCPFATLRVMPNS